MAYRYGNRNQMALLPTCPNRYPSERRRRAGRRGRKIVRLLQEEVREKLERQYEQSESREVYKRPKSRVEHPFGHIKRNLGITNFLLRGRKGVQAELSIAATCFNIARMITLFGGVKGFIVRLCTV